MNIVSKKDFDNWKSDPVTKAFFDAAQERITDSKDILAKSAGLDQISDNFMRGFIQAYVEMLEFSVDFEEDEE